jgi:hypothetical protein
MITIIILTPKTHVCLNLSTSQMVMTKLKRQDRAALKLKETTAQLRRRISKKSSASLNSWMTETKFKIRIIRYIKNCKGYKLARICKLYSRFRHKVFNISSLWLLLNNKPSISSRLCLPQEQIISFNNPTLKE